MTKYFAFAIISGCFLLFALPGFTAPDDRVCLYKNEHFRGHEQCYRPGDEISDLKGSEISSIRISGSARAILYENRDFKGRTMNLSTDVPDLEHVSKHWHDHVGSLRVTADYSLNRGKAYDSDRADRYKPFARSGAIDEGVCVYERPAYEGRFQCWAPGTKVSDLHLADWRDDIASVRVVGHARLAAYRDPGFRGERVLIDHDVPNVTALTGRTNWSRGTSSIEVQ